jgi:hypothetical protein
VRIVGESAVATVKEREIVILPGTKTLGEERSYRQPSFGDGGTNKPPPNPPGGGPGGNEHGGSFIVPVVVVLIIALIFWYAVSEQYASGAWQAIHIGASSPLIIGAAWILTLWFGVLLFKWLLFDVERTRTIDALISEYKRQIRNSYHVGFVIILVCFHSAIVSQTFGMIPVIELLFVIVALAYLVDRLRAPYFPQSGNDIADFLASIGGGGRASSSR